MDFIKEVKKKYKKTPNDELFNMIETNLYNLLDIYKSYSYKLIKSDFDKKTMNDIIS